MDVGRALLKFAVGYPLGVKGLDWLKIHLVNLHGEKKKYVQAKCTHNNHSEYNVCLFLYTPTLNRILTK